MNKPFYLCQNSSSTYCLINKTVCWQTGNGREVKCPVCGWVYDPEARLTQAERNQRKIDEESDEEEAWFPTGGGTYFKEELNSLK